MIAVVVCRLVLPLRPTYFELQTIQNHIQLIFVPHFVLRTSEAPTNQPTSGRRRRPADLPVGAISNKQ